MLITKATVSHWMATLAGADYYELSAGHTVPEGLASDPPRYSTCVARLEATAAAGPSKTSQPSGVQLLTKCRQMYQALRLQAVGLLVLINLAFSLAAEQGVSASDAEVLASYNKLTAERFPSAAERRRYLAARRTNVADEFLLAKKDLLVHKLEVKLKARGRKSSTINQLEARWISRIDCRPGYVVEHCKQFHGPPPPSPTRPPAAVLMEQVTALATGRCTNIPACGKQ